MNKENVTISFSAPIVKIRKWLIVQIPEAESIKLPSRGQISVKGVMNGYEFKTVLEPDGRWSHWYKIDSDMKKTLNVKVSDRVEVTITPVKDWPEPIIPSDFAKALDAASDIHEIWAKITPMARWEWIRWVNATTNDETRDRRIEVSVSKLRSGKRRPCCFNLAACTDPYLSKSGRLINPTAV